MKKAGASSTAGTAPGGPAGDGRTREGVARTLLERGPVAATEVAGALGVGVAAVRRHLDALVADGEATSRVDPQRGARGRGRPARLFLLTAAGRARFGSTGDGLAGLAVAALGALADSGGDAAVRAFAERRVTDLVGRHRAAVAAEAGPARRAGALAAALTGEGYPASVRHVGAGAQLCQHHCPVADVAARYPQLCEAETAAFADLLGTHVQRLATIARGDAVCTTHLPGGADPVGPPSPRTTPTTTPDGGVPA